jgi:hypothetical protein
MISVLRLFVRNAIRLLMLAVANFAFPTSHNIGAFIKAMRAGDNASLTAAGAGDNTQVVGAIIDRSLLSNPLSLTAVITAKATLAASKKLTLKTVSIQHGDQSNLSDTAALQSFADVDVLVDSGSGSTISGQQEYDVDLAGAKRYVQLLYTPDLNAASVDTATTAAVLVFGGSDTIPL